MSVFHSCCVGPVNFLVCPHSLSSLYVAGVKFIPFVVSLCLMRFSVEERNNLSKTVNVLPGT